MKRSSISAPDNASLSKKTKLSTDLNDFCFRPTGRAPSTVVNQSIIKFPDYDTRYSLSQCPNIQEQHKAFIESCGPKFDVASSTNDDIHHPNTTVLYDCINKRNVQIYNEHLTLTELYKRFGRTGHSFALPVEEYYSPWICFDLDNTLENKASELSECQMTHLKKTIIQTLSANFKTISEFGNISWLQQNTLFMVHDSNVHVYINLHVSIQVYNRMVDTLNLVLMSLNYKVDKLLHFPLPFSAYIDYDAYKLEDSYSVEQYPNFNFKGSSGRFYDYNQYDQGTRLGGEGVQHILTYTTAPLKSTTRFLPRLMSCEIFVTVTDDNNEISMTQSIPEIFRMISKLHLKSLFGVQSSYQLLNFIVKLRKRQRSSQKVVVVDYSRHRNIQRHLDALNVYIGERLYSITNPVTDNGEDGFYLGENKKSTNIIHEEEDVDDNESCTNLMRRVCGEDDENDDHYYNNNDNGDDETPLPPPAPMALFPPSTALANPESQSSNMSESSSTVFTEKSYILTLINENEKYSLYLIFVCLVACCSLERINDEDTKRQLIDYILPYLKQEDLKISLQKMYHINVMEELMTCFGKNYEDLLDFIILRITMLKGLDSADVPLNQYVDRVIAYVSTLGEMDDTEYFDTIIKIVCQPLQMDVGDDIYIYNYQNDFYEKKRSLDKSPAIRQIFSRIEMAKKKCSKDMREAICSQVVTSINARPIKFNEYTHFINTECGVFYTVTGTYLIKTPFLRFNMSRQYCTIHPEIASSDISIKNSALINAYDEETELLECYLSNQTRIFYLTVMLPGLLYLDTLPYFASESDQMWSLLYNFIDNDPDTASLFCLHPILDRIKGHTMCVARMIEAMTHNLGSVASYQTIVSTYDCLTWNKEFEMTPDPKLFANACTLFQLMRWCEHDNNSEIKPLVSSDQELGMVHEGVKSMIEAQLNTPFGRSLVKEYESYPEELCNYTKKRERWMRAWSLVFPSKKYRCYLKLFIYLSEIFEYNEGVIRDFYSYHSEIYQPAKTQKHMCLYFGPPRCGKTSTLNILNYIGTDSSVYRTSKSYKNVSRGGGPSPNAIHMKSKYFSIINEIEEIGTGLLKTMTGDDSTNDDRTLYSTRFQMLNSCTFLVGACNRLPKMFMPDEAVRDRLVIFSFKMKAVDNLHTKAPNCLKEFTRSYTHKQQIDEKEVACRLSHTLYLYHRKYKNENGIISARTTNSVSLDLLDQFMISNNWVYAVLDECNVKRSPALSFRPTDLKDEINETIEKYNKNYNKQFSFAKFMNDFKFLFKNFYNASMDIYIGMGVQERGMSVITSITQLEKAITIVREPGATTRLKSLTHKLMKIVSNEQDIEKFQDKLKKNYELIGKDTLKDVRIIINEDAFRFS